MSRNFSCASGVVNSDTYDVVPSVVLPVLFGLLILAPFFRWRGQRLRLMKPGGERGGHTQGDSARGGPLFHRLSLRRGGDVTRRSRHSDWPGRDADHGAAGRRVGGSAGLAAGQRPGAANDFGCCQHNQRVGRISRACAERVRHSCPRGDGGGASVRNCPGGGGSDAEASKRPFWLAQ
jgi:hypothetical protein